jgi:hypothetical protein
VQGCVALERLKSDQVFIRELLIPEQFIPAAVKQIARLSPAKQYVLRIPSFLGQQLEGTIRPFGMIRMIQDTDLEITAENQGYLGFAFD